MLTTATALWPTLTAGDLHLRSVRFDQSSSEYAALDAVLVQQERDRAARFVFERDRRAFVICRGTLRIALGRYLDVRPESIVFSFGPYGKPFVAAYPEIAFNLSHAGELGVFAFALKGPIGVDVECVNRNVPFDDLARRFFSEEEAREFGEVPSALRAAAFFNCWTRKEAYIKALGEGLSCPLDSFSVTLRPGSAAEMRWIRGDDARRWWLASFEPTQGYTASVAAAWRPTRIDNRMWNLASSEAA